MMGFVSVSDVLLLIALAGGYIVFYLAKREEAIPRLIGYAISTLIIGSSISYMMATAWMHNRVFDTKMQYYQRMMKSCGPGGGAMPKMSPMMPRK